MMKIRSENDRASQPGKGRGRQVLLIAAPGFGAGILITLAAIAVAMPKMMIVTHESKMGFDETVRAIQNGIDENGWSSPGTDDMNKKLAARGVEFEPRVNIIRMCQPEYARSILTTDRHVSCLMPCSVSVWEGDDGKVFVSKMNTGLMGRMFGGNIARVMGGMVARDEAAILGPVTREERG